MCMRMPIRWAMSRVKTSIGGAVVDSDRKRECGERSRTQSVRNTAHGEHVVMLDDCVREQTGLK